jgi:hypothetical protein
LAVRQSLTMIAAKPIVAIARSVPTRISRCGGDRDGRDAECVWGAGRAGKRGRVLLRERPGAHLFTVTRDFVRTCRTPVLMLPDDIPAHPYAVAMEAAMPAPRAEDSMFPWKEPKERIPPAVRQIRSFLRAHRPARS